MSVHSAVTDPVDTDILIVGAGMAGLYSAWRLNKSDPSSSIHIIEQLDRTGGRLDTDHVNINGTALATEEGGMRFMYSQLELMALLKELDLTNVPFPMGDENNQYYLRGNRFTVGDAKQDPLIWSRIYHLNESAKGKQPGEILTNVRNTLLKQNGQNPDKWQSSPENWTELRLQYTYREIPLNQWGFWAMLEDMGLTQDCIQMLYESSGFIAPYNQQVNAGCALQLLVDFVNPQFHHIPTGYSTLPDTLAQQLKSKGTGIETNRKVIGIDRLDNGRLRVTAQIGNSQALSCYECSSLILGVTQLALQQLMPRVAMFRDDDQFIADINSVTDMALGKVNLYYPERWWENKLKINNGGSFTDLPMAQFYCYQDESKATRKQHPGAITIYTDYYRSNYWAQLQRLGKPFPSADGVSRPPHTTLASEFVVAAATRQMQEMFDTNDIPQPLLATYKRWMDPQSGDGDHQWRIGIDDRQTRARLSNPFDNIYICGESYSDDQTWVNGALRSVDYMLSKHFDV